MAAPVDLEHLTALARSGDREAVGRLWQHLRRFVATVLLANGAARDLDDQLQEVALRMTRSVDGLADAQSLRPWLRTIACRVAIDGLRRRDGERRLRPVTAEPLCDEPLRQHWREELEHAMRKVADLDPRYREPLLLRAVEGCSQKEIADVLCLPESTVETRLARARRHLREAHEATQEQRHEALRRTVD